MPKSNASILAERVAAMARVDSGYDVVIICTSDPAQAEFWQSRLDDMVAGQIMPAGCVPLTVFEDWPGGAGNGLGTLYAYQKAVAKAKTLGFDLPTMLAAGKSVALYHTAGKGTRLAPLPGSESNNKPGVKLPGIVKLRATTPTGGTGATLTKSITILEAVIKQTSAYAASRGGRMSVYWGDQIFIPLASPTYVADAHVDILARLGPFPSKAEWAAKGLDKYGLIAVSKTGAAAQVEKVSYDTASELLAGLGDMASVGTSLGSFSVGHAVLAALLTEFAPELAAKASKLDTDPHFWMPMTLPKAGYVALMTQKGDTAAGDPGKHWERIASMMAAFKATPAGKALPHAFGAVDVGAEPYWWDYGQLKYYYDNNRKMTLSDAEDAEAAAMRAFFAVPASRRLDAQVGPACQVSGGSVVLNARVGSGSAHNCVLVNCDIGHLECRDAILVNVTAHKVKGDGIVLYNLIDDDADTGVVLEDHGVAVDVAMPSKCHKAGGGAGAGLGLGPVPVPVAGEMIRIRSNVLGVDGKKAWDTRLDILGNTRTFGQVHAANRDSVNMPAAAALRSAREAAVARRVWNARLARLGQAGARGEEAGARGEKAGGKKGGGKSKTGGETVRLVVQRCESASLLVDAAADGWVDMGRGLIVFVSFTRGCTQEHVAKAAKAVVHMPLLTLGNWGDGTKPRSLVEFGTEGKAAMSCMLVPQAGLTTTLKGKSLQYHSQASRQDGETLFRHFVAQVRAAAVDGIAPAPKAAGGRGKTDDAVPPSCAPEDMFMLSSATKYSGQFSAYDDKGLPVADAAGNPVSKSGLKKLAKIQKAQAKKHAKWVKAGGKAKAQNEEATTATPPAPPTTAAAAAAVSKKEEEEDAQAQAEERAKGLGRLLPTVLAGTFGGRQGLKMVAESGPFVHAFRL